MKVYKGTEFVKLPIGTLYSEMRPDSLIQEGLYTKSDTWIDDKGNTSDWIYSSILEIESESTGDLMELTDKMFCSSKVSVPCNKDYGRDGGFNHENRHFLVWEKADLEYLAEVVKNAIEVADKEQNND